ncbi:hypothetical protein JKA74_04825 [Marivirga sp. S37H4]|uniref:Uncharacterized protein n=1 Tax=Marivirga aurantiaca TaxID=2802615 RepID=A0A934WWR8_9BACT|nr:hypothetical protein [Marivirga aurantiaca]MBK6264351.1 hypothetical protein [Marivirga aurantiaca]
MDTKKNIFRWVISSVFSGFVMWVVGGIYHNLIMPAVNENIHPHHEGLGITLIAYILLGLLMSYFYKNSKEDNDSLLKGIRIGMIIGVLWVFPHGLTMAAIHESSISYEITNTIYHIVEQGIGGAIIFASFKYFTNGTKKEKTKNIL